jgi:anthranilate phosphoribosyltransferase
MSVEPEIIAPLLKRLATGEHFNSEDASHIFATMMAGTMSPVHIAAFLTGLAVRGPSVDEITAGARVLRDHAITITAPKNTIDLCGTGGDGHGTLNVSTAVSFVVAACGVPVAKHGNRAMSSRTGGADVLESLGVALTIAPEANEKILRDTGICFLYAQAHHPAMKHVAPVRRELGFRTIFNLLGPLSNPAAVKRQLLGVYDAQWLVPVARTLQKLGATKAWVVHGNDGLDEITTTGTTQVAALENDEVSSFSISPEELGLHRVQLSALKGEGPAENAEAIRALFGGAKSAFRDIVLVNAAAALVVADKVRNLPDGMAMAAEAIDQGRAAKILDALIAATKAAAQ